MQDAQLTKNALRVRATTRFENEEHHAQAGFALEEEGMNVGSLYFAESSAGILAFDWTCSSRDKSGAAALILRARRMLRTLGHETFFIHFEGPSPTKRFWEKFGKKKYEIYEIDTGGNI